MLQRSEFVEELYDISERLFHSLMFDAPINVNNAIRSCVFQIHDLMASYGYSQTSMKIENNAYINLMLYGANGFLAQGGLYAKHFKFCISFKMMLERMLLLYSDEKINEQEILIFEQYRNTTLYDKLTEIYLRNKLNGGAYRNIMIACEKETIYCSLLYILITAFERNENMLTEEISIEFIQQFVAGQMKNIFVAKPFEPIEGIYRDTYIIS